MRPSTVQMKNFTLPSPALPIMLSIPAIQLGHSYYISIAFGMFSYCLLRSVKLYNNNTYSAVAVSCLCFLLKGMINATGTMSFNEVLLPLREMVCFVALIFISQKIKNDSTKPEVWSKRILIFLSLMLLLVVFQNYKIGNGQYFGIPVEYFVTNAGALGGAEDALFHQTRFRPTSFFGEPSYTAFVVLSLLVIFFETPNKLSEKIKCTVIGLIIVAVSQSLAGLLAIVFVFLYWVLASKKYKISVARKYALILVLILVVAVGLYFSDEIYLRFINTFTGGDESSTTRLNEPASLLVDVIQKGALFGVDFQYIEKFLGYSNLDNALFRFFIYYGLLIIIPLATVLIYVRSGFLALYIILTMNFNGDFFSYDKVLIVALVVGLSKAKSLDLRKVNISQPAAGRV